MTKQDGQSQQAPDMYGLERSALDVLWTQDEKCYVQAETWLCQALEACPLNHGHRPILLKRLAKVLRLLGRGAEAEAKLLEANALAESFYGMLGDETVRIRQKVTQFYDRRHREPSDSKEMTRRRVMTFYSGAIDRAEKPEHKAVLKFELAVYCSEGERFPDEARSRLQSVLPELLSAQSVIGSQYAGHAAKHLGWLHFRADEPRPALQYFQQALQHLGYGHECSQWLQARVRDCEKERHAE